MIINLIELAILEDIGPGDITSDAIFNPGHESECLIISKDSGIFCGGEIARLIYQIIDPGINTEILINDGTVVSPGTEILKFTGPTISLLRGERIVLNFLQRLSGIATETNRYARALLGTSIQILDTRKTLPGFRALDKYAVMTGGGKNHRMGLYDMVMIKDNHIKAAGSITAAVRKIRVCHGSQYRVEVEAANLSEVREALESKADVIMLDNMDRETMGQAIQLINEKAEIEISGNVELDTIDSLKDLKVTYISSGALTHSVRAFDLSMKFRTV
ncbi:MAG: nicotinate-nucleotide diphosphorylase (carboxylating) [Spirochaetae bacterium HGW-Spirochaetae-1]|jgi:nicotinate-nucleotide pyrophosphorylase (carboxylating)|nr:MAG: nicotinate-nucleotide diphosphorylase (carboxylating) [Spirochaetae bacterium HGW-Spirochaetae-1]